MKGFRGSAGSGVPRFRKTLLPGVVAGVGLWLSFGAVSPVDANGVNRVGALPSLWLLLTCLIVVPALAFVLNRGRARVLYFGGIALLPWVPVPIAALLVWQGPILWALWIGILLVVAWPGLAWAGNRVVAWTPATQRRLAIAVAAAIFLGGAWRMAPVLPGGDEPHYLIITQSLLKDGDLRIENNHQRRDYLAYTSLELKPDYLRRGRDGAIYSIHAPGLPAVIAPAFALGGYAGVIIFLSLVSALGAALVWHACWRLTNDPRAAWFGWASVALTTPFLFQAFTVYPDGLGAVLVMTGIVALVDPDRLSSSGRAVAHGAALALLPWLHTRYALLAIVLGVVLVLRMGAARERRSSLLMAFAVLPVVSAACWFLSFYMIYGTFNPAAPYGGYTQSRLANAGHGLTGLLVDQQFGILPNAPIYAAALAGLWTLGRIHRRLCIELVAVIVPYTIAVACYRMWWGGHSSPGRFIVPILIVLGVPCGVLWQRLRGSFARALLVSLLAASVGLALVLAWSARGELVYNFRDGISLWVEAASPIANLPLALPSLFRHSVSAAWTIAMVWLLLAAGVLALAVSAVRRLAPSDDTIRTVVAPAVVAAILTLGPAAGWAVSRVQAIDVGNGLWRVARGLSHGGVAIRPLPPEWAKASAALRELLIPAVRHGRRPPDSQMFLATDVPAGDYQLVGESGLRVTGSVAISVGRNRPPMFTTPLQEAPPQSLLPIHLPAGAREVTVSLDRQAQRDAGGLRIRPVQVWDSTLPLARSERTYGDVRLWCLDERTMFEDAGFWTAGQGTTEIVVSADAPRLLTLTVRNGPVANQATVAVKASNGERWEPGREQAVDLAPNQQWTTNYELRTAVLVSIRADQGFRPVDVDPKSTDQRMLGVWASLH